MIRISGMRWSKWGEWRQSLQKGKNGWFKKRKEWLVCSQYAAASLVNKSRRSWNSIWVLSYKLVMGDWILFWALHYMYQRRFLNHAWFSKSQSGPNITKTSWMTVDPHHDYILYKNVIILYYDFLNLFPSCHCFNIMRLPYTSTVGKCVKVGKWRLCRFYMNLAMKAKLHLFIFLFYFLSFILSPFDGIFYIEWRKAHQLLYILYLRKKKKTEFLLLKLWIGSATYQNFTP